VFSFFISLALFGLICHHTKCKTNPIVLSDGGAFFIVAILGALWAVVKYGYYFIKGLIAVVKFIGKLFK
jgi:hypothetical protein